MLKSSRLINALTDVYFVLLFSALSSVELEKLDSEAEIIPDSAVDSTVPLDALDRVSILIL